MSLLRRAPAPAPVQLAQPAPAPALAQPDPDQWTPEGLLVRVRYLTLGGARVLLYARTLSSGLPSTEHGIYCLGCTAIWTGAKTSLLTFQQGREDANRHAGECRALPTPLPARPDDETALQMLIARITSSQQPDYSFGLHVGEFASDRVRLQRTDAWIEARFATIADQHPDLLTITTETTSCGSTYVYRQVPSRRPRVAV